MPSAARGPVRAVRVAVPPPPPKRIQVVTRGEAAPTPEPAPITEREYFGHGVGLTRDGILGIAIIVVAALTLVLNFSLDWYRAGGDFATQTVDRDALKRDFEDSTLYARGLLLWPVLVLIGGIVVGAGLLALDFLGLRGALTRALRMAGLTLLLYFGFVLALTGDRLLGLSLMGAWAGDVRLVPLAVPYLNLVAGLGLVGASLWRFRAHVPSLGGSPALRTTGLMLAVAAGAFLLDPLLPFARLSLAGPGNDLYLGEGAFADPAGISPEAEDDLGFVLGMLWIVLYVAAGAFLAALAERDGRLRHLWSVLIQANALTAIPILVGAIFTVLFYVHLPEGAGFGTFGFDVTLAYNYVPALAYVLLGVAYVFYVARVLRPFLREAARGGPGPAAGR